MRRKTVVTALPTLFAPISTSTLPFLYQTRTLARPCVIESKPIFQSRYTNIVSRRCFGRCAIKSIPDEQTLNISRVPVESGQESTDGIKRRFRIRKIPQSGPEPEIFSFSPHSTTSGSTNDLEAEAEAESDHSRSVVRRLLSKTKTRSENNWDGDGIELGGLDIPWGEAHDMEFEKFDSDGIPEEDNIYHEKDEIDNLTNKPDPRQERTSTITPSEKLAFQKIFSDIFARSRPANGYGLDGLLDEDGSNEDPDTIKGYTAKMKPKATLDSIFRSAIQSREDIEAAVNRYPPALRAAAARAMGHPEKTPSAEAAKVEKSADVDESYINDDRLERLRKPERDRVEGLMRSASTDFELWTVMQKEVFPLITKLGLQETPEEETPAKNKRRKTSDRNLKDAPFDKSEQAIVALATPDDKISPLEFYGPLYPSYLLLGLRLLDRSFAKPSTLTLSILPEIKSMGIISHVLGASTQLYNELLLIHWYRHDDFRGVLNLLNEMEQFGLDWDKETWDIIDDITKMQNVIRGGDRGPVLKALWSLPEYAPDRFKAWKRKIGAALSRRSQDAPLLPYSRNGNA